MRARARARTRARAGARVRAGVRVRVRVRVELHRVHAVASEGLGVLPSEAGGDARGPIAVSEELAGARAVAEYEGVVQAELHKVRRYELGVGVRARS